MIPTTLPNTVLNLIDKQTNFRIYPLPSGKKNTLSTNNLLHFAS